MTVTKLIEELQAVLAKEGDIKVYTGNMVEPHLDLNETSFEDDEAEYGKKYIFIEEGR